MDISEDMFNHIKILSYSYANELHQAPYVHFIDTYGKLTEDLEVTEEEHIEMVKEYLYLVAKSILKTGKDMRSTFAQRDGKIFVDKFVEGITSIGLEEMGRDAMFVLFRSLKSPKTSKNSYINFDEFEDLMSEYGVRSIESESPKSSTSMIVSEESWD